MNWLEEYRKSEGTTINGATRYSWIGRIESGETPTKELNLENDEKAKELERFMLNSLQINFVRSARKRLGEIIELSKSEKW